jgi:hypothetical protein
MHSNPTPPIFADFRLQTRAESDDFFINPIGAKTRKFFMPRKWFDITDEIQQNEDLFEWIDLLEAVRSAEDRFVMLDLGAGYGRWLVNGALASRQLGKDCLLVGLEAEDTHYRWMLDHFADNDVEHKHHIALHGPVSDVEKDVWFTQGHPGDWYGQTIQPAASAPQGEWPDSSARKVRTIAIRDVLDCADRFDSVHADLQGEEAVIFPACIGLLSKRAKRVHIGTHSPDIDRLLHQLFSEHGWQNHFAFPCQTKRFPTPFGLIEFQDGVQSWLNPQL